MHNKNAGTFERSTNALQSSLAISLEAVVAEIRELHAKGNEQRERLGHPAAPDVEQFLLRSSAAARGQASSAAALNAVQELLAMREKKASELLVLALRGCGRSLQTVCGSYPKRAAQNISHSTDSRRQAVPAVLATVEALMDMRGEIESERLLIEKLRRENAQLEEDGALLRTVLAQKKPPGPGSKHRSGTASVVVTAGASMRAARAAPTIAGCGGAGVARPSSGAASREGTHTLSNQQESANSKQAVRAAPSLDAAKQEAKGGFNDGTPEAWSRDGASLAASKAGSVVRAMGSGASGAAESRVRGALRRGRELEEELERRAHVKHTSPPLRRQAKSAPMGLLGAAEGEPAEAASSARAAGSLNVSGEDEGLAGARDEEGEKLLAQEVAARTAAVAARRKAEAETQRLREALADAEAQAAGAAAGMAAAEAAREKAERREREAVKEAKAAAQEAKAVQERERAAVAAGADAQQAAAMAAAEMVALRQGSLMSSSEVGDLRARCAHAEGALKDATASHAVELQRASDEAARLSAELKAVRADLTRSEAKHATELAAETQRSVAASQEAAAAREAAEQKSKAAEERVCKLEAEVDARVSAHARAAREEARREIEEATAALARASASATSAEAAARSERAAAAAATASAAELQRVIDAERRSAERANALAADRLRAVEGEAESERERANMAERHAATLDEALQAERKVLASMSILLSTRLAELESKGPSVSAGVQALRTVLSRSEMLEAQLSALEALLRGAMELAGRAAADRMHGIEAAADRRQQLQEAFLRAIATHALGDLAALVHALSPQRAASSLCDTTASASKVRADDAARQGAQLAQISRGIDALVAAGELSEHQLCTALTMRMEAAASLFGEERERLKVQLLAAQERIAQLQAKGSARSPGASSKRGSKSQPLQATVMENPLAGVRQVKIGQLSWGVQPGVDALDASGRNAHS